MPNVKAKAAAGVEIGDGRIAQARYRMMRAVEPDVLPNFPLFRS
jgi:hypothetical protein